MKYNPRIHHRRSIRLKGYDYSQAGLYYITICVKYMKCLFGEIVVSNEGQAQMQLNDAGKMVHNEWLDIPNRFPQIKLHEFIVMPNHFHAIMEIVGASTVGASTVGASTVGASTVGASTVGASTVGASLVGAQNTVDAQNKKGQPQEIAPTGDETVGDVVGAFKSITTNKYIDGVKNHNWPRFDGKLWQRNYWEHIIRDEKSYQRISDYIINNPLNWAEDKLYRS